MTAKFFGQFLLERGKIIKEELLDAIKFQKELNVKLGTIALDAGYLTAEQIEGIFSEQQCSDKLFGEIAIERNMLSQEQLEDLLAIQKNEHITLGEALLQKGYLTLGDLEAELAAYKKEEPKLTEEAYQAIENLKTSKIAKVFLELTIKLWRRLGDLDFHVVSSLNDKGGIAPHMWNVYQKFHGDIEGVYVLSLTEDLVLRIGSAIVQEQMREMDALAKDSGKEFVNIVVGNSATQLSGDSIKIDLLPAQIVNSANEVEIPPGDPETVAVNLRAEDYDIQMGLVYFAK